MGIFSKINKAKGSRGGLYLKPGNYVVQVLRCKLVENHKKKTNFIVELKTIESDNETLAAESEPSFVVNMDGEYPDLALGNVADLMRAGIASLSDQHGEKRPEDLDDIEAWDDLLDEDVANSVTGEENLLSGVFLTAKAWNHETAKGGDFTRVKWGVPDNLTQLTESAAA